MMRGEPSQCSFRSATGSMLSGFCFSILLLVAGTGIDNTYNTSLVHYFHRYFSCHAYSFSLRRPRPSVKSRSYSGFGAGGNGEPPRRRSFPNFGDSDGDENGNNFGVTSLLWIFPSLGTSDSVEVEHLEIRNQHNVALDGNSRRMSNVHINLRGGGGLTKKTEMIISSARKHLPFFKDPDTAQSKFKQQEQMLASTNVTSVTAPKSEILPPELITQSAEQAKLIGGTLTPSTLDATANSINNWYISQGYVMNSVTGATLVPSNDCEGHGRVELKVREAKMSKSRSDSVIIRFVEECSHSSEAKESDNLLNIPIPNYSEGSGSQSAGETQKYQRYRVTSGRTRPTKVAKLVGISPGSHFRIIPSKWSRIVASPGGIFAGQKTDGIGGTKSAIFSTIHAVRPIPAGDDTVLMEIIATENKPYVALEYGVTKSLYSDQWEGEFDLKHSNAFGGGEVATFNVRKGRSKSSQRTENKSQEIEKVKSNPGDWNKRVIDGPLSWRMSIADNSLGGGDSGYDLELFRDHVGLVSDEESETLNIDNPQRTGATMRLRFPQYSLPRAISVSVEKIDLLKPQPASSSCRKTVSMTMHIGPINFLRSALSALLTAGVQHDGGAESAPSASSDAASSPENSNTRPYFSGTVTSQQIIPLCRSPFESRENSKSFVDVAVRHVASVSTKHLPQHEAIMLGLASRVRGYKYNQSQTDGIDSPQGTRRNLASFLRKMNNTGQIRPLIAVSNSICGNVELRLPFSPFSNSDSIGDNWKSVSSMLEGTLVVFGDWALTQGQLQSPSGPSEEKDFTGRSFRHSSVGVGFRKVAQGIPLKIDACITEHGTGGLFFGIGRDFGA
ncbi:hypothetical protein HJC23_000452 [Cyclotella cryptica]|uniref:Bacterial surface antigen (D15) domain-containing protein n=1 Tax=Cyclotella cryptica TaxID=29204 RepID=A0ABD3QB32_9STRA